MLKSKFPSRILLPAALIAICAGTVIAQTAPTNELVRPVAGDRLAARQAKKGRHARPANTPRGATLRAMPMPGMRALAREAGHGSNSQTRYPGDLVYNGGPVVESAQSHAIYLRPNGVCPIAQCWGNPEGFLRDLSHSDLIHVVDQYVGLHADRRYTVGSRAFINITPPANPFTDDDMLAFVHAVASKTGETGYGHIYHVFLPQGVDECFDSTFSACYSPDNPDTFVFCAYHGYADFADIGHVLYSVEPYQGSDCADHQAANGPPPNGVLIDSTNDTLSHELIEAITDPDLDAWWNSIGFGMFGEEIADECLFADGPATFRVGNRKYAAQTEYSNEEHACVVSP